MKKGRDTFTFQLKEPDKAQALINEWLQAYNFTATNLKGETCYMRNDPIMGHVFFNYQIQGNQLTLWIWQRNITKKEVSIYNFNAIGGFYRDIMNQLLEKISAISINQAPGTAPVQNGANMNSQINNSGVSNYNGNFRDLSNKTDEKLCIVGFIMALANTGLVLLGDSIALGGLGYVILFICAARGLKTQKRNLAIATIILGIVSLVIFIFKIIAIATE